MRPAGGGGGRRPLKIRALIVDDERLARRRVRRLLGSEPGIEIVGECADGPEAIAAIERQRPDLVFLDVQLPGMDGFGVLRQVAPAQMPVVVFVTAYEEHALRAFEVHALDYLLKPYDQERFGEALRRARAELEGREQGELNRGLLALLHEQQARRDHPERLAIRSPGRTQFVRTEEVDWIEAAGNYARLHVGRSEHLLREPMQALENRLDPRRFLRIHRSTIVNVDRIQELQASFQGEHLVLLRDGTRLTLSRGYRDRLERLIEARR